MVASLITALSVAALAGGAALHGRARAREARAERAFPPEGQIIAVGDRRVHAVVMGQGPDVVLIHGASGNLRDFTFAFLPLLAQAGYRAIAVDRPGLGYSSRVHDDHVGAFAATAESPGDQAGLLAAALAQIGVNRPVVVGHSYGATVAIAWALDHGAAAMVSLGGVMMPWPDGKLGLYYRVNGSRLGGAVVPPLITAFASGAQVDAAMAAIFAPDPVPPGYAAHVGAELTVRRATLRANARQVNALYPSVVAMSARYAGLRLPVEILHGAADTIVPAAVHAGPSAALIPGAGLHLLPGVGHMPHHVSPEAALATIYRAATRAGLRRP